MKTTAKRITYHATKEDMRLLEELMSELQESQSQVIRRAITKLYESYLREKNDNLR